MFDVRFHETAMGRSQPRDFLGELPRKDRMLVAADIEALRVHGLTAPISTRIIEGEQNRGLVEIRTGNFRTFYCMKRGIVWILHVCKKEHQRRGIETATARMKGLS